MAMDDDDDVQEMAPEPKHQPPAKKHHAPLPPPVKPEVVEQLACLAANVTLRLVGTRWRM
ncbi:hypothetical protein HDU96_003821, partial [Phlyctochytrium bullatum]